MSGDNSSQTNDTTDRDPYHDYSDVEDDDDEYDSPADYSVDEDYNSEDDEFLAFHDADIEAQVRGEIRRMQERREAALQVNTRLRERRDEDKMNQFRQEQIALLGSETLYHRVNNNFKLFRFEAYFAAEQFKLYTWREDFFHEQFEDGRWFTTGADDSHSFDTVPFQITQHFDDVLALACSNRDPTVKVYFENDECKSAKARNLFDSNTVKYMDNFLEPESLEDHRLSFSDALHILYAAFPSQPLKLEHIAMKKALEIQVPLTTLPKALQVKADKASLVLIRSVFL